MDLVKRLGQLETVAREQQRPADVASDEIVARIELRGEFLVRPGLQLRAVVGRQRRPPKFRMDLLDQEKLDAFDRDFEGHGLPEIKRTERLLVLPDAPEGVAQIPQVLAAAPLCGGPLARIDGDLVEPADFRVAVRRALLHLLGERMHQRLQRAGIILKARHQLIAARDHRDNDVLGVALDRDVVGVEDVAMHVDDPIDGRHPWRLRQCGLRNCGAAGCERGTACYEIPSAHGRPL